MQKTLLQTLLNMKLIIAAAEGRSADFSKLLREGADINGVEQGRTPLIAATLHHRADAVRALIELNARVDATDAQGNNALSYALHHDHTDIARLLVQAGADINIRNAWGDTRLTVAARSQNQPLVDDLIALQADVNLTNSMGQSALVLANNHMGIVRSLLLARADLAHAANNNAVLSAVIARKPDVATLLLFAGATPNAVDWTNRAALTHAADQGNASLIRCLIAAKADPNDGANQYALASAVARPDSAVLQALLDNGARVDTSGHAGQLAVVTAIRADHVEAIARWYPAQSAAAAASLAGERGNPMALAVAEGSPRMVGVLRDAGLSLHVPEPSGYTLLMLACLRRHPDLVSALLQPRNGQPGLDPNDRAHVDGYTALMAAAIAASPEAMRVLLAAGANPSAVDRMGLTALDHAARCSNAPQRTAMEFMLAEALAARALERAGQPQRPYTGVAELMASQEELAASAEESAPDAWADWADTMNDIDDCDAAAELAANGALSLLPYHMI